MKRLIYFFTLLFFIATGSIQAQTSQDVSFVPGLNEPLTVWDDMAAELGQEFIFTPNDVLYNDQIAIETAVNGNLFPTGTVSIGHSLGGLISREFVNQNGTGSMNTLITVGTPNTGAPVADAIQTDLLQGLAQGWYSRLISGPLVTIDFLILLAADVAGIPSFNTQLQQQAVANLVTEVLTRLGLDPNSVSSALASDINQMFGNVASVDDMRPGSSFLNQLNDNPEATLPASRYAIHGSEGFYSFVRLFDSFEAQEEPDGNPMEQGNIVEEYFEASTLWLSFAAYHLYLANRYKELADQAQPGSFDHFRFNDYYGLNLLASQEWFFGFNSFVAFMPAEWKANITKSLSPSDLFNLNFQAADADDGLLSRTTQAPAFFETFGDGIQRRLEADGANHIEQTVHPSVKQRLEQIFDNSDVLIDRVQGGGDGGDGDGDLGGGDGDECLADRFGNCIEF